MSHAVSATRGLAGREWRRWRQFGRPAGLAGRGNDCIYVPSCTCVKRIEGAMSFATYLAKYSNQIMDAMHIVFPHCYVSSRNKIRTFALVVIKALELVFKLISIFTSLPFFLVSSKFQNYIYVLTWILVRILKIIRINNNNNEILFNIFIGNIFHLAIYWKN